MKEISTELLDEITKRLAESIHPERIYLFGSQHDYVKQLPDCVSGGVAGFSDKL